jgi:hypothetical protein
MELNINVDTAVMPQDIYDNGEQVFKIRSDENGETVIEDERKSSKGGTFKQYTLLLENEHKEEYAARYLFAKQLKMLIKQYGTDTKAWAISYVKIGAVKRVVDGTDYYDLVLQPHSMPESAAENVS